MREEKKKKLPENWKEIIHNVMSEGGHVSRVMKELGISIRRHQEFYAKNKEYQEAIDRGKLLSEAWWAETGRQNVTNKQFNHILFIFMMKSVFKWKDTYPTAPKTGEAFGDEDEKVKILAKYRKQA